MRILLLTFYYPPDLSAGSYRAQAIVEALREAGPADLSIDVVTTMPNRYATYAEGGCEVVEGGAGDAAGVRVERLPIASHRSGLLDQCMCFAGFAFRAIRLVRGRQYDLVLATSSRLFTGYLGALIARRVDAGFYLDVRDLFVETMTDLFRRKWLIRLLLPLLARIERFTMARADRVNLVSPEFMSYCTSRFPDREFANYTNGIDPEFFDFDYAKPEPGGPKVVLYAGNIGLGQGLERIVPDAARRLGDGYLFRIIGDGGRREALAAAVRDRGVDNVEVLAPVGRAALKLEYRKADVLLLHLNDARALDRVLPSKIFEYAATGKPIIAGARGYARSFIEAEVSNAVVFDPCDAEGLMAALSGVTPGLTDRSEFNQTFSRQTIMRAMAADILQTV